MPDKVTPNDDSFHLEVLWQVGTSRFVQHYQGFHLLTHGTTSFSYTYGKPVQGVMKIALYPVDIPWWMVYYDRVDPEMTEELGTAQGVHVLNLKKDPMRNEKVYLVVNVDEVDTNITLVTDENGMARFSLDTSDWNDMVSLTGRISFEEGAGYFRALQWLFPFYSESNSFLKVQTVAEDLLCSTKQSVSVEYTIDKNELDPESDHLSFFYIVSLCSLPLAF
ncbi:alpha-2-macroglobulin-like protein 1 [Xenopus tropicalis]|uniref:Alpha-2-macroglobulin-like protein 1 n=1 Tax=Xenopus tropicalis TaxID=8364 RepID=A0A8J1JUP9_XENTR|nr:alpha-2-macroglobulin-like protein 1 [Xenopus tropicalis]